MEVKKGYVYHIKGEYFDIVQEIGKRVIFTDVKKNIQIMLEQLKKDGGTVE